MTEEFASSPCCLAEFGLEEAPPPVVEPAVPEDAAAVAAVLVASIRDLCAADHRGEPEAVARWTANKTPEQVRLWIADTSQDLLVVRCGYAIAAVGATSGDDILLNYVAPAHRFAGHSTRMLAALEARMRERGVATGRLVSTETAHGFYLARGWQDEGGLACISGLFCRRMRKDLSA